MQKIAVGSLGVVLLGLAQPAPEAEACTNFLVTRGASADGSTMITYAADSHVLYGELYHRPAAKHAPGALRKVFDWDSGKYLGTIPQVAETFSVVGNMNEHQVVIGETTYGGRKELRDPKGGVDYGSLMYVALERARTAREAIKIMTDLVAAHGYYSVGESFSIADPKEVWIMDLIGKGPGEKGAVWVARRVPEGYVSAHANQARIQTFPRNDPQNTLFAKDVVSFARKKGYFTGADADFSFAAAYAPASCRDLRVREARVWSFFRRIAPKKKLPIDYVHCVRGAAPMPLWIKPDRKLSARDLMTAMRDHFEGTPFDMRKDVGAGPFALPYRWRPLVWKLDGKKYLNERAIATQQTGFSFVSQSRAWLPGPIGGLLWFSVDDAASTVYVPMYAGITKISRPYAVGTGSFNKFSWDSAFWVFNWVSNFAYTRYKDIIQDIQKVQSAFETRFITERTPFERRALALYKRSPAQARALLTDYSAKAGEAVVARWKVLGTELLMKYLDGNVRDAKGKVTHPPYPKHWYRRIVAERGEHFLATGPGDLKKTPPLPKKAPGKKAAPSKAAPVQATVPVASRGRAGCGCQPPGATPSPGAFLLLVLVGLGLGTRRRPRRPCPGEGATGLPRDGNHPLLGRGLLLGTVAVLTLSAVGCDPGPDPEDPRVTAQWEAPATCGAEPYTWIRDPTIGTVLDWQEDVLFDYSAALLDSALAASGFRIEKPFLYDVRVFRFRYVTQDRGGLAEATSTIAVPVPAAGEPTAYPLLAYLHGTAGFSDDCAPSADFVDPLVAAALASIGHIVVGPDYLGMVSLGPPSPHVHPYLVSEPTALSSADAVRAGRQLLPALELDVQVTAEPGLSVLGGSQGGHAALALAWYASYYAPELEISGVAASVPPADLLTETINATAQRIDATSNLMAFLGAYADWYGADLSEVLLPPHDSHVPEHLATECSLGGIASDATDVAQIFTPTFLAQAAAGFPDDGDVWSCMLRANSFPFMPLEPLELPPTLFVLSEADELVDTPIERGSFDALCARGWPLQYLECAGVGHADGAVGSFAEQLDFLADRRAGANWPAADQCVRAAPVVCSGTDVN